MMRRRRMSIKDRSPRVGRGLGPCGQGLGLGLGRRFDLDRTESLEAGPRQGLGLGRRQGLGRGQALGRRQGLGLGPCGRGLGRARGLGTEE